MTLLAGGSDEMRGGTTVETTAFGRIREAVAERTDVLGAAVANEFTVGRHGDARLQAAS